MVFFCVTNACCIATESLHRFIKASIKAAIISAIRPKFAALFGPEDKSPSNNLRAGPTNNCALLAKTLKDADPSWHVETLTGASATKAAILQVLRKLMERANAAAPVPGFEGVAIHPVVLVYFAGHGLQLGTEQYMVPYPEVPSPKTPSAAQAVRVTMNTMFLYLILKWEEKVIFSVFLYGFCQICIRFIIHI